MDLRIRELCHVAISCKSIEKSIQFYEDVFGFRQSKVLESRNGNVKLEIGGGTYLELFPYSMYESEGRGCIPHFALTVESVDSAIELLSDKGLSVLRGPFDLISERNGACYGRIVFYAGPDGEEIELIERNFSLPKS